MSYRLEHRTNRKVSSGRFYPLGCCLHEEGANFALYSRHASQVFLLLFDEPFGDPTDIIQMEGQDRFIWHCFVHGVKDGQLYGYKVRGDFDPGRGLRFNEHKLLLDPYAKALTGKLANRENLLLAYDVHSPAKDLTRDTRDDTRLVPKSIIVDDDFDWQNDAPPDIPPEKLLIYEVHVKGFTAHRSSGVESRGTYLGFVEKIPYLKELGINAVELLPIHELYVEDFLREKSLNNYWGYNTVGFFAPESSYSSNSSRACQVTEFKTLVRELHKAGIEVYLDVVYNHTAEGNELGPTLSLRGIDNPSYYCLTGPQEEPGRYYVNYTGCGNSLDLSKPPALRLVMDSLRYWVEVMHVDGFRFDLAAVLGRESGSFQTGSAFFDTVSQDPVLSRIKLIAEPWDIGTYQVGNFPVDFCEWNGRFRDAMRRFGKGEKGMIQEAATRLTGSSDLYKDDGRMAYNSINFITCHDGFTLCDLLSYNEKHNEANLENNRDGTNDNNSWNCGVEGPTDDPKVISLRRKLAKNCLCYLIFSGGTPMLLGGDEHLRTQQGNNNAYCQDNEISWFDWDLAERNKSFTRFVRKLIAFTRRHTILQRRQFFTGIDTNNNGVPDIEWFGLDGRPPLWDDPDARTLCLQLDGSEERSEAGDYLLFLILNAHHEMKYVKLPEPPVGKRWYRVMDTSLPDGQDLLEPGQEVSLQPSDHYLANERSTVLLLGR